MKSRLVLPFFVCAAVSQSSVPATAIACEACSCEIPWGIRPRIEEQELPRNARFLVDLNLDGANPNVPEVGSDSIRLAASDGKVDVAFKSIVAGDDPLVIWVVPDSLLEAKTEYLLTVGDEERPLFAESFKTSDVVDETPPQAGIPEIKRVSSSSCGASMSARVVWDSIPDDGKPMLYEPVVKARVEAGEREVELFLDATNVGKVARGVLMAAPADDADADCWGHFGLPFSDEESVRVSLTVYDRAGNAQELEPIEVPLSQDPGATCRSDSGDCGVTPGGVIGSKVRGSSVALMLALAGLFWIRKRTTTATERH